MSIQNNKSPHLRDSTRTIWFVRVETRPSTDRRTKKIQFSPFSKPDVFCCNIEEQKPGPTLSHLFFQPLQASIPATVLNASDCLCWTENSWTAWQMCFGRFFKIPCLQSMEGAHVDFPITEHVLSSHILSARSVISIRACARDCEKRYNAF